MKEVLKLALEALELNNLQWKKLAESGDSGYWLAAEQEHYKQTEKAITAIRTALAQTVQEPVAWWIPKAEQFCLQSPSGKRPFAKAWEPLYATPPAAPVQEPVKSDYRDWDYQDDLEKATPPAQRQWVGLTDEEVIAMSKYDLEYAALIGEVQKKLKEKNNG